MSVQYKSWLPESALLDGLIHQKLQDCIANWAEKWFAKSPNFVSDFIATNGTKSTSESDYYWHTVDGNLVATISLTGSKTLAKNILDVDIPSSGLSPEDDKLLTIVVTECLESFIKNIAEAFQTSQEYKKTRADAYVHEETHYELIVKNSNGNHLVTVKFKNEILCNHRKSGLNSHYHAYPENALEKAVDLQKITLGAHIGVSKIQLGNLEVLSHGDVVVLNKRVGEELLLTVNQRVTPSTKCELVLEDEITLLKLVN